MFVILRNMTRPKPNPRLRKSNAVLHVWRLDTMLSHVLDVGDQVGTALLHQIQILLEPGFDSYPDTAWIPVWIPGFFQAFCSPEETYH